MKLFQVKDFCKFILFFLKELCNFKINIADLKSIRTSQLLDFSLHPILEGLHLRMNVGHKIKWKRSRFSRKRSSELREV